MSEALELLESSAQAKPATPGSKENPANTTGRTSGERQRIPMSVPVQKLSVPEIPGFHLHWMRGDRARIQQALRGGYEFVAPSEVDILNAGIGTSTAISGNTDMGDRVSVASGDDISDDGQTGRLYLMKIRLDWYVEDQKHLEARNEQIAAALRGDPYGAEAAAGDMNPGDPRHRTAKLTEIPDMFRRKPNKGA